MGSFAFFFYRLVIALWVGGISIFTFLVTPLIFRRFRRDQAGEIVEALMGSYFLCNLALSALGFVTMIVSGGCWASLARWTSLLLLAVSLFFNGFVNFSLYPRIEELKKKIQSFEQDPDSPARAEFRSLHSLSMRVNLGLLGAGVLLLALLPSLGR